MSTFLGSTSGLTPQRLRGKRYHRLSRDLYVLRGVELDVRCRCEALLLALPDAVPCLFTAALLQNLPVDDDGRIHVARGRLAPRTERPDVKTHRIPVDPDEVLDLDSIKVTDGPRTFVDLAAWLDLERLVAVGDVVLRRYGRDALAAAVARRPRRKGIARAREALPLLDAGAASPQRDEVTRQAGWEVVVATAIDDRRPHLLIDKVEAAYLRSARMLGEDVLPRHLR